MTAGPAVTGVPTVTGDELLDRLARLHDRVAVLVGLRSADDPTATDPLRGLFLSPAAVARLLDAAPPPPPADDEYGPDLLAVDAGTRLGTLAERFGLSLLDLHILVAAMAPDLDRRFEPLYGYLNDDVGRKRASVALALELTGLLPQQAGARARFYPDAPLVAGGLLILDDDPALPLPGRALRVPERVIGHLLSDDSLDGALLGFAQLLPATANQPLPAESFAARLATLLASSDSQRPAVHLREDRPGSAAEAAIAALQSLGRPVLRLDPGRTVDPDPGPAELTRLLPILVREARLRAAAIVVGPLPPAAATSIVVLRALERAPVPVVLFGAEPYDPSWSAAPAARAPVPLEAPDSRLATSRLWFDELGPEATGMDLEAAVAGYRLGPDQVRRAAGSARALAVLDGAPLAAAHLQQAARRQSAPLLDRHARRVPPGVGWTDLVLPAEPLSALKELVLRARQRDRVLGEWRMRSGGGRGRGVVALFAGESGTGKTMSAEVVAGELGMDMYVVQLSAVVDKYIGETEKNLERIFSEADHTDAVLLFDEADAVFGKRSEVKDSHDKYANMQSAYLLQRLESFDGIALLTTNLRANIDDAFTRRLDLVIEFPFPDPEQRSVLWRHCLAAAPCAPDLDLRPLAARFELSGGAIHSAAVTAAYLAAGRNDQVTTADVLIGAEREYRKMGRLVLSPPDR